MDDVNAKPQAAHGLPRQIAYTHGGFVVLARCAMRRIVLTCTLVSLVAAPAGGDDPKLPLLFTDDFESGADRWQPTDSNAWRIVKDPKGGHFNQHQMSKYKPPHRSPLNMALVKDLKVADFVLEAKLQSTGKDVAHRDMCLFFGYQDPAHFYYVHIAKQADDHPNQIFIVNGADRKKISKTSTKGTPWDDGWHHVK